MRARAATITLLFNDSKSRIDKFGISVKLSVSWAVGHFEDRSALGTVGITPRKFLDCHSTRASRRIPVLFFHAQEVALIESMSSQRQALSEE